MFDDFTSAKQDVTFELGRDGPHFPGRFVRNSGGIAIVAVTPAVRDAVAAAVSDAGAVTEELAAAARQRVMDLPTRKDGLVCLDHLWTRVVTEIVQ